MAFIKMWSCTLRVQIIKLLYGNGIFVQLFNSVSKTTIKRIVERFKRSYSVEGQGNILIWFVKLICNSSYSKKPFG